MSSENIRQSNFNIYQSMMDRSLLQVKLAGSMRMQADIAKLNEKYDGKTASRIEDQINKIGDQKTEVSSWLRRVETGLKAMNDVRLWMLEMKSAIGTGSGLAFDNALDKNNYDVNRAGYNSDSLISNPRGSWSSKTEVVSAAGISAEVTKRYLGNDYVIEGADGKIFKPGTTSASLVGDGRTIKTENLTMDSYDSATNTVVFTDNTDPDNPRSYTGTVKRGGAGALPAWLYGNFVGANSAENKTRALADMAAAFKNVARAELDYNIDQAQLSGMDSVLESRASELSATYRKITEEELSAKQAERRAIQTRFDVYNNSLALTSARGQQFIYHMFMTKAQPEKIGLQDIMLNQVR